MYWIAIAAGAALILIGLNDVFHTLFHPAGRGRLSTHIVKGSWRVSKLLPGRPGRMAGPVGIVLVILVWALLQVVGWALVYLPEVPGGFTYSAGINPGRYPQFAEALYISLVTLATLGFGDVVAVNPALRLLSPLQALTGFVLFTAAVSWLMQLYPALARRRTLALRVAMLRRSDHVNTLSPADATSATLLHEIAAQVAQVRVDLGQNAETYYFAEADAGTCLPSAMRYGMKLSERAQESTGQSLESAGAALGEAVADLAAHLREQFLPRAEEGTAAVIDAALDDHGCDRQS